MLHGWALAGVVLFVLCLPLILHGSMVACCEIGLYIGKMRAKREIRAGFARWASGRGKALRRTRQGLVALGAPTCVALDDRFSLGLLRVIVPGTRRERRIVPLGEWQDALDEASERLEWETERSRRGARRPSAMYR